MAPLNGFTFQDLLAPVGRIEPDFFPADTTDQLEVRLGSYLVEGYTRADRDGVADADRDQAARSFAYHEAFTAVWTRLSAEASSISLPDEGGQSRTDAQRAAFKELADRYLQSYLGLVPAPATSSGASGISPLRIAGGATRTRLTW